MNKIKELLNKYKEFIKYGIGGGITTLLHLVLFWVLIKFGLKYYIANIITLITIKTIAYFINKIFVFKSKCNNKKELLSEIIKYILSRLFTMIIDYFGLILLVEVFKINELVGKIIVLIVVVIINYFLCKKIVYKKEVSSMKKIKEFLKKHWFILAIIILCLLRFLFTYKLPSFYLSNMNYDDLLMVDQSSSLMHKQYLGEYGFKTLVKGPVFPFLLFLIRLYKVSYSIVFTLLYIGSCVYFIYSLKNIINNKKYLIIVLLFLLFNPATFSQDLFQRLYRNSISMTEFLFFFGSVIRVLFSKNIKARNYLLFGLSLSLMFLTREDNLWTYPVIAFIIIYNIIKYKKIRIFLLNLTPVMILIISLNLISIVNYKHYGIYTYNEIQKSEFHNTYKKILQIKDDEKKEQISIPKSTFYKLAENSKVLDYTKEEIDDFYKVFADKKTGEIYNGNMIWYFRCMVYNKQKFKNGKESEKYYKKLGKELDKLFKNGTLEKEFVMPSNSLAVPTKKQLSKIPKKVLNTIIYTVTYKDIKTFTETKHIYFDIQVNSYFFKYLDYHHTVNIVKKNPFQYEIIRIIYYSITIVFGILSLLLYLKNIKRFDSLSINSHLLLISYLLIIGGTVYTHITSFHAIRPLYLGNIYIIQTIFILLNICRLKNFKEK